MNCQRFESVVPDLARGQMMDAEVRSDALAHSSKCEQCSARLRNEESLTRGLRALSVEMSSLSARTSLESGLLDAFRQHQVVVPLPVTRSYRRYWLTAVAAMLLIVLGVVAMRWNGSQPEAPQYASGSGQTNPVEKKNDVREAVVAPKAAESPKPIIVNYKPKPKRRPAVNSSLLQASSGRPKNENVQSNHAEVATEFMPLGYLNPRSLQDGGQIVRVEVPRTTLASFGIPVNMERYNERVKADILLSVDGRAQAIRFVQDKREE